MKYLTDSPDQRQIWVNDFEKVAPTAVEEIVRLASPVTYMRRTATTDTILGDQEIKEGDKVCMFYLSANRDEDIFEDSYRFDVLRQPNNHVGFVGGSTFLPGCPPCTQRNNCDVSRLFHRLPDIQASGEPDVLAASFIHGVKHLPATFSPVARDNR